MINDGEVELGRITKTVLVIDEAQDMDKNEFALIEALMRRNENMRVIAVGDDDQNIYEFRGSHSRYLKSLISEYAAFKYEMTENYRSCTNIVALSNAFATGISDRMKSAPGEAVRQENGIVQIIQHTGTNLEEPVVNQLIATYHQGSACVLTNTNDEALRVMSLLIKRGIRAKLIQSNDGFQLFNLAEIRFFLKIIDKERTSPVISDSLWQRAKERLQNTYRDSSCLTICCHLIADFEETNRTKYWTDLMEFVKESKLEDFYEDHKGTVLVSTIHKAKGREFDNVYMLLNQVGANTDEEKRKLYVGLTRAKRELYIHENNPVFGGYTLPEVEHTEDACDYPEPPEMILPLSHRDVVLDFFKGKKELIFRLCSGAELHTDGDYFSAELDDHTVRIAKMSKACAARLHELSEKGYLPYKAIVRFVVAWKGNEDKDETAIVLPDLYLKKS